MKYTKSLSYLLFVLIASGCSLQPDTRNLEAKKATAEAPVAIQPVDPIALKVAALNQQQNKYSASKKQAPAKAVALFSNAVNAKRENELEVANEHLSQLTKIYPNLSGPWVLLGDIALQMKDAETAHSTAVKYYKTAVEINPHNYFAHNRIATLFRQTGKFDQALTHYQQALNSWPAFPQGHRNIGILYDLYLGKKNQALEHYHLYQALLAQPDRQVSGWIADVTRQLASSEQAQIAETN